MKEDFSIEQQKFEKERKRLQEEQKNMIKSVKGGRGAERDKARSRAWKAAGPEEQKNITKAFLDNEQEYINSARAVSLQKGHKTSKFLQVKNSSRGFFIHKNF